MKCTPEEFESRIVDNAKYLIRQRVEIPSPQFTETARAVASLNEVPLEETEARLAEAVNRLKCQEEGCGLKADS
jgi:hypothetical protein